MRFAGRLHRQLLTKKRERAERTPARAPVTETRSCVRLHYSDTDFAETQPPKCAKLAPGEGSEPCARASSMLARGGPGELARFPPSVPLSPLVFTGMLKYLDSRQRWRRREIRCDGRMLVCLRTERVPAPRASTPVNYVGRLPPQDIRTLRAAHPCACADPAENRRCVLGNPNYLPGGPPTAGRLPPDLPPINHPLFATPNEDVLLPNGSFAVQYFQDARWVLPLADIAGVTALAQPGGEKLDGSFALYTTDRKIYVFQAADDAEASLWMCLLTTPFEAISAELTPSQHSGHLHRRNAVRVGKKSVSWDDALTNTTSRDSWHMASGSSFYCARCTLSERHLRKRPRGRAGRTRPPRRDSLLHAFEDSNYGGSEVPDAVESGDGIPQRLGEGGDPVPPADIARLGRPPASNGPLFPAVPTPRRPVTAQDRSQSRTSENPPVVLVAKEEYLPLTSPPLPVPPLRMRSLLAHSQRHAMKIARIESAVPHVAALQFAPSAVPSRAHGFDLDAAPDYSVIERVRPYPAARSLGRDAPLFIPPDLLPDEARKEILSRAKYLLREIRCASGFIPVPAGWPESERSSTRERIRRRLRVSNTPVIKVSRLPVVIALEHLEDVVDELLFRDRHPPDCTLEEAEAEEPQYPAAKDAVRRIIAEIMRHAHKDVMKLVGEGGTLAANSDLEAAIASVELLVVVISPDGLRAID